MIYLLMPGVAHSLSRSVVTLIRHRWLSESPSKVIESLLHRRLAVGTEHFLKSVLFRQFCEAPRTGKVKFSFGQKKHFKRHAQHPRIVRLSAYVANKNGK